MKKIYMLFVAALTAAVLAACGDDLATDTPKNENAIDIYTTVYPLQFFAEQIGGEYVNVQSIYPPGANEHTFEPTQKAMIDLADADLFFYIGLGLEGFVEKSKATLDGQNVKLIATADDVSEELLHISTGHTHAEAIENVENGHSHDEDHDHHDEEEGHEEEDGHSHSEHDSHVWLSPVIAEHLATVIKDELIAALPEQEQLFTENYNKVIEELKVLHGEFEEMAQATSKKTFFVSHAAFGYYAGHYGLNQVPVAGLNSQSEPSQKELASIVDLAKKEKIDYIFFEQNVNSNLAKVIQNEIGAKTLILHNLSVLTKDDVKNGEDYFSLMRANIEALKTALQ